MSFANRQVILHRIREVFSSVFGRPAEDLGLRMVYDVAHNTAKLEEHVVDGAEEESTGASQRRHTGVRARSRMELPARYQKIGQPVIIGGSMETGSYLLGGVLERRLLSSAQLMEAVER